MIMKPSEMNFSDEKYSIILYGAPGIGKSTAAASAPNPLMFDLDKGLRRVKVQHRPTASFVDTYEELLADLQSEEAQQFDSIIIDTAGALVTMILDYVGRQDSVNRQKNGAPSQKGYGAAKLEFKRLTDLLKYTLKKNVIYVFHSVEDKDKEGKILQRLLCDGSAKNIVWQPCDFGGYMYKNGKQTEIDFSPSDEYFAKGCYGISGVRQVPFGDNVPNDFLTKLFAEASNNLAKDKEFFDEERKKYEDTMKKGAEIIDAIETEEDANGVGAKIKALPQYLTSLVELRQLYKDKIKELGFMWDSATRKYIKKASHETNEKSSEECEKEAAKEETSGKPVKEETNPETPVTEDQQPSEQSREGGKQ